MASQSSRVEIRQLSPRTLTVIGTVDAHTVGQLASAVDDQGCADDLTLNLAEVEFIDSSGLRTIIGAHQQLEAEGHRLRLASLSPPVTRLLEITGLLDLLYVER